MRDKSKAVCCNCIDDYALKHFIEEHKNFQQCSFCHRRNFAIDACLLRDVILERISAEYDEVTSPYDKDVELDIDIFNLIFDYHIEISSRPNFLRWFLKSVGGNRTWHDRAMPVDGLSEGWEDFKEAVKFHSRFLLFDENVRRRLTHEPEPPFYVHPGQVIDQIGKLFSSVDLTLRLPRGTEIFRARAHPVEESLTTPGELGPPPAAKSKAGRMNAAGIVVFYGARDERTAILETERRHAAVSVGTFLLLRPIIVLDLVSKWLPPSIFDAEERDLRDSLKFLTQFRNDIAQPVHHEDSAVDYIPTQVVSEFLRNQFTDKYGNRLDGILYPSVKSLGGSNLALFASRAAVEGIEEATLEDTSSLLRLESARTLNRFGYSEDAPSTDGISFCEAFC